MSVRGVRLDMAALSSVRNYRLVPYLAKHERASRPFELTKLSDGQIADISGHRSAPGPLAYQHLRNEHQLPITNALDAMVRIRPSRLQRRTQVPTSARY